MANRVFAIRLVQWLGWVFETQERKKQNTAKDSCRAGKDMVSREDLDGEYYDRVFGGEDSDSDMAQDMSDEM